MQPLPSGEDGCANGRKNRRRAQGAARASGDRLFFLKCAEGDALSRRTWKAPAFTSHARDGCRMAKTALPGLVHESPVRKDAL